MAGSAGSAGTVPVSQVHVRAVHLHLPGTLASVRVARRAVQEWLRTVGADGPRSQCVALVVTELVTNGVTHGGGAVQVAARRVGPRVRVEVTDRSDRRPVVTAAGPATASRRGMAIVDALVAAWGVDAVAGGKVVWAELDV